MMLEVNIKQVESFSVCGLPHRGSYMEIGKAFECQFSTRKKAMPVKGIALILESRADNLHHQSASLKPVLS